MFSFGLDPSSTTILYVWGGKAYARLGRLAGLSEPLLVTYAVSTIMSWAGEDTFLYLALIFGVLYSLDVFH